MHSRRSRRGRNTWVEAVRLDRDTCNVRWIICRRGGVREVVRVARHRRNVIVGATAFVEGEEEGGVLPRAAVHQRVHEGRHISLPYEDGLLVTRMLVILT